METDKSLLNNSHNIIIKVEADSIADEMNIEPGDVLLEINNQEVFDIFDYRYLVKDEYIEVVIRKPDGEEWLIEIEKEDDEDLGIVFENGLMDNAMSCKNKCIFCFIDQLPKGMRQTLYFKDDDSRLSFLQGNYVTLTNMSPKDLERILFYRLSPINISVHTTDADLRKFMLKNPNSANLMGTIEKIAAAGIDMNFQIVLVKGVNDGEHLHKSIEDLSKYIPRGKSLSVVPVGITKYREGLFELEPFTKRDATNVIEIIDSWQKKLKNKYDTNFVFASDEFYITAGLDFPHYEYYEDFPQIENGVGMAASFREEVFAAMKKLRIVRPTEEISVVTGVAASALMREICTKIEDCFGVRIHLYIVENTFFGKHITVSGLLCGADIIEALKGKQLGNRLLISKNAFKRDEDIMLDDTTIQDLEQQLNTKIELVDIDGQQFLSAILNN